MNSNETQNERISQDEDMQPSEFQNLKERLAEIANTVDNEEISLDEALDLYEEAVILGLQAADLLDVGITAQEEAQARILSEEDDGSLEDPAEDEAQEEAQEEVQEEAQEESTVEMTDVSDEHANATREGEPV